jgi:hypothetical protein
VARAAGRTIVPAMAALALVLHLALAAPGVPATFDARLDPGPFQLGEVASASLGILAADAAVLGGGYGTLRLMASGTIRPSADNFRSLAYGMGTAALLVPPLTAVLLATWARAEPASGAVWKALLLAVAGEAAALAVGYYAAPRYYLVIPAQLVAVVGGTTFGLHWGPSARSPAARDVRSEPADPPRTAAEPLCPDPALALVR